VVHGTEFVELKLKLISVSLVLPSSKIHPDPSLS